MIADLRPQAFGKENATKDELSFDLLKLNPFLDVAGAKLRTPQPLCLVWLFAVVVLFLIAVAFSD